MPKVLDQEKIDALIRAARQGAAAGSLPTGPVVQSWDIHQARKIGREQLQSINHLHENFARNLGDSLGAFLRTAFECHLVSAEHLSYSEFLATIPSLTYFASCVLAPVGVTALLQIDLAIAFPIIDLLLGGEGKGSAPEREISEIEAQIIESVVRIIFRELQNTWQALSLQFNFGRRQPAAQVQQLMPPEEKNLCLSFEIKIADARGTLNLAVPAVASNALLRKISVDYIYERPHPAGETRTLLQRTLQHCPLLLELVVSSLTIPARLLVGMTPGTVLPFSRSVSSPAALEVDAVPLCSAIPARVAFRRAARVLSQDAPTPSPTTAG